MKDDIPIKGSTKGWVSSFHKFLTTLLYQINREEPEIKLINESNFTPSTLDDAGIIISILTTNLEAQSEISTVLDNFGKSLKEENKLLYNGIPCFFKVLIRPFDSDRIVPELEDLISYDFYLIDPLSGDTQEFTDFFGSDAERGYWMKLVDMAYDINQIIHMSGDIEDESEDLVSRDKTVYLASTGVDMVIQRDIIKRELMRHGYKVLPNHTLPKEYRALDRMIRDDLDNCRLSIHLIGEDYGYKPKGSELSVVDIQNRVSSDHTYQMAEMNQELKEDEKQPFSRLIWVSPDLNNVSERQKIFIEDLKSDAASLQEAEVLQISLQELKSIIREELVTGGRFKIKRNIKGITSQGIEVEAKLIYLIADKRDINNIEQIKRYLKKEGFNVVHPSYEGDLVDLRYIHQENLRRCDAAIIYYGESSPEWIRTKLQDLLKAPGFGRDKPMLAKAVYIENDKEVDLDQFKKYKAMVLGRKGSFKPVFLKPFLSKVGKA